MRLVAVDIETSGLSPAENELLAVGIVGDGIEVTLLHDREREMLSDLEAILGGLRPGSIIVTWNGEEFDLPFLSHRFTTHNMSTRLRLSAKGETGKYGKPLFKCSWGRVTHVDIAPMFQGVAEDLGVTWSLKPVARELLGLTPIEVDRRGEAIAKMSKDALTQYVMSDARITYELANGKRGLLLSGADLGDLPHNSS